MATDAEIRRKQREYQSKINANNNRIRAEKRKIERLNDEIERLQRAYDRLESLEDGEASELKRKTKVKTATSGYDWRGEKKNDFDDKFENEIYPDANELKKYIDDLMDEINWEIHDKKTQRNSSEGIIGSCKNAISWFSTCIRNLTN